MAGNRSVLLLLSAMLVAVGVSTLAEAETILRLNRWLPPTHNIQGQSGVLQRWAGSVTEATGGRVKVDFTAASLGPPPRQYDLARDGIADVVHGVHAYTPSRFRLTQLVEMPFLGDNGAAISAAYWKVHHAHLAAANEHRDVKLLGLWVHGPGLILNRVRAVRSVDDLNGLKIRVAGGLMTKMVSTLGAVPIAAPVPKLYEILSRGVADGVFFTAEGVTGFRLERIVKHVTQVPGGLFNTSFFLAANTSKWKTIASADRKAIEAVSGATLSRQAGKSYDDLDRVAADKLRGIGIGVITADARFVAALKSRLAGLERDWIADANKVGVDGEAALRMLRAEVAKEIK